MSNVTTESKPTDEVPPVRAFGRGYRILAGLTLGVLCGITFGEWCQYLRLFGDAYVGLLQMTVLPYLVVALILNLAQLDVSRAKRFGVVFMVTLLGMAGVGVGLIILSGVFLPESQGVSLLSPVGENARSQDETEFLTRFIPTNIYRSLTNDYIPAVVVFCIFLGSALMTVPNKGPLLQVLRLTEQGLTKVSSFLARLAPYGLFFLAADAAGTLRIEELSRLQTYLLMVAGTCVLTAFLVLPLIVSSVTNIKAYDMLRAASEPLLTAIATGKLLVVLPQIVEKCDLLLSDGDPESAESSTAHAVVPMAYPFPHLGKVLALLFLPFAAWYVGKPLSLSELFDMSVTGTASSFASPLVSIPYLLDRFQLPQDLISLFLLPGFITTRFGDVVGVMSLMTTTLIVCRTMQNGFQIRWRRLMVATALVIGAFVGTGAMTRAYLDSTVVADDLDRRIMALKIESPSKNVVTYLPDSIIPPRDLNTKSTLERINRNLAIRVGYHADHIPYSFINSQGRLVGMDVEMMHRMADSMQLKIEFVPFQYDDVLDKLNDGEIDVAVGGILAAPRRISRCGFTESYETATVAVMVPDHRRRDFTTWDQIESDQGIRLGLVYQDNTEAAITTFPNIDFVTLESYQEFFDGKHPTLDGIVISAEEGAAWSIFHPEYAVAVPSPVFRRPVAMAFRSEDVAWGRMLDQWMKVEKIDGGMDKLRNYWLQGGGVQQRAPRWSIVRDVLGWTWFDGTRK